MRKTPNKLIRGALLATLVASSFALNGCAIFHKTKQMVETTDADAHAALNQLNSSKRPGAVHRSSTSRLAGTEVLVSPFTPLPAIFDTKISYLSTGRSLSSILTEISLRTGMAVQIQPGSKLLADRVIPIDWKGSLKGLFDQLANARDMQWRFQGGAVQFFQTDTRAFSIYLPAGKRDLASSISLSGVNGEQSSKGNSLVAVSSTSTIDPYDAIVKSVEQIVLDGAKTDPAAGGSNKSVIANPTLGLITVTSTPAVLDKVDRFIRAVNDRFAKNVTISVKVYNLNIKQGANAGASATISYENIARSFGAVYTSQPNLSPSAGTPSTLSAVTLPGPKFGGTAVLLQALEQIGDVSLVTSGQVVAANGQPAPLQVANEFTYLASSSTVTSVNAGVSTTLIPGTRMVGFTANFLPLILGDNRVMLQYQINLSSLLSLNTISSGSASIQTPSIATQSLQQQAFIRDGQTLVLFGYEQARAANQSSSSFLGGSRNSDSDRSVMVIVMEVNCGAQ